MHRHDLAKQASDNQGKTDPDGGVEKSAAPGAQHLVQVHAEAEAHDCGL